jgi:hypothetical protein
MAQRTDEMVFGGVNAIEDAIVKMLFSKFVPEVLGGSAGGAVTEPGQLLNIRRSSVRILSTVL